MYDNAANNFINEQRKWLKNLCVPFFAFSFFIIYWLYLIIILLTFIIVYILLDWSAKCESSGVLGVFRNRCTRVKSYWQNAPPPSYKLTNNNYTNFGRLDLGFGFWRVEFSETLRERSPHNPMPRAPRLLSAFPGFLYLYHPPTPPSSYYNLNVITRKTYLYRKRGGILN